MPDIRSSTLTSSYTSGTLTIATPTGMHPGDFLVVYLVALGVHWGSAYYGFDWTQEYGNPPDGQTPPPAGGIWPSTSGPPLSAYPHSPPISTMANSVSNPMDRTWTGPSGTSGFYTNYWSNLGQRITGTDNDWDTPENAAVLHLWPFIDCFVANRPDADYAPHKTNAMSSLTVVGRVVDGTEASSYNFTLNNPLDAEYDYRAFAVCFEPSDWSGNYFWNPEFGNSGSISLNNASDGWWVATGTRTSSAAAFPNITTQTAGDTGDHSTYNGDDGHTFPLASWPLDPESDYPFVADLSTGQQDLPTPPLDQNTTNDLLLNIHCYAGPTSAGDPSTITVADLSATTPVDPLSVLHQEVWTKGASTLMVQVTQTHVTPDHAVDTASTWPGTGLIHLTARVFEPDGGPITATYPDVRPDGFNSEIGFGLAMGFRVRVPAVRVAIPSRLATIVG